jgi:unsaturated chondroitin disaccharide hydrolase
MTDLDDSTAAAGLDAVLDRVDATLRATGEAFPLVADDATGEWETTPDGNWCGGHWIGLLWLARDRADAPAARDRFADAARSHTATMRASFPPTSHFFGMNCHYAGFRAYDRTDDRAQFGIGLAGADAMVDLFDERARQVPAGTFDTAGGASFDGSDDAGHRFHTGAVDNVYTALPVLWRAYEETTDPRFRDVAVSHADRHLDWYLRADGSTCHHATWDPETGALTGRDNELGYGPDTCWARGLGWHVAGLARAYDATGARRYLDALASSVSYYVDGTPGDLVPRWDFEAPDTPDEPRDTSAAALVAYGLTGIDRADDDRGEDLRATGRRILASLVADYTITGMGDRRGAVRHGCYDGPGAYATDAELIWTTYYLATALDRFLG